MLLLVMLTRRTNLLLTEEEYQTLLSNSKKTKKTKNQLMREALRKFFGIKREKSDDIEEILKEVHRLGRKIKTKGIDYKEMINYGRKY